jgi:hypothetical protein
MIVKTLNRQKVKPVAQADATESARVVPRPRDEFRVEAG